MAEPDSAQGPAHDPAKARFYAIATQRLLGALLVVLGMLVLSERLDWTRPVGFALLAGGLFAFFVLPIWLARKYRTPKE